ncbi:hypothetical protein BDZ85DRAFT_265724 [Elsinoe ampelina]|uniref:Ketopantoate reductase N-terminal domain-containing protein n=1 Tax=Elsinoe ampelina TaxID=302913 RepID=A0A6A6G8C5_9PEZI|nr:hypothetical protein BDZ85DRAFT_265724 [Elsinoe ampelina]
MSRPKILIVGAGAVGLAQGYHLSFGADITYLVRPGRKPAFLPSKRLYDYKANALRTFESYRVIESPEEVSSETFLCVFDTLDGSTARSDSGRATISAVGNLIRDHADTFVVFDAVGLDMKEYYASTMGISMDRLLLGASMLAHQPTDKISKPPAANQDQTSQADMFFAYLAGNAGMMLSKSNPAYANVFKNVYAKNPTLSVSFLPPINEEMVVTTIIVMMVGWHTHGWGALQGFINDSDTWPLMVRAQKEILSLPRYGWIGYILSFIMGSWSTAKLHTTLDTQALPLLSHEFNKFHHGAKVLQQDFALLQDLVEQGEKEKHSMPAVKQLIQAAEKIKADK